MGKLASRLLIGFLLAPVAAFAQDGDNEELNVIQVELEREAPAPAAPIESSVEGPTSTDSRSNQTTRPSSGRNDVGAEPQPMDFQGLGRLAPFTEVSVIQKRFLPKTGRFQLFGGLTLITNDPFFNTMGAVGKLGYFFTESVGLELNYFGLTTTEAKATTELKAVQGVKTDNLILTKNVVALDLMFVPIYGKMAWFNERIVPFDLYFSLGYGQTGTQNGDAGTLHLATGQIFALSKATAVRWDFSWNFFNAKGIDNKESNYNNLFLTIGMSWFFPEANYR